MLQIGLILLLFDNYYFTMVEEIFEIWHSEMLQIGLILLLFDNYTSPWLKKILKFDFLKRSRLNFFLYLEKNLEIVSIQFCIRRDPTPSRKSGGPTYRWNSHLKPIFFRIPPTRNTWKMARPPPITWGGVRTMQGRLKCWLSAVLSLHNRFKTSCGTDRLNLLRNPMWVKK